MSKVKLAVLGAGLIGKRHMRHVQDEPLAQLIGIVDPSPAAKDMAAASGVRWTATFAELLAIEKPDGIIVATPNQLHVANGLESVAAGVPALIEKPIADDVASAEQLVEAAEKAGVPLLVGHHRRHNPLMRKAKEIVSSGQLGRIVVANATFWLFKPEDYFDVEWRRRPGAGPVFINLIHDVDNFRYLFGDVVSVQARESNAVRGNAVEETAVILLEFAGGVLATLSASDTVVAPWSWEMTAGENPAYPKNEQSCYLIGGTHGSLALPSLELWRNQDKRSWWEPFEQSRIDYPAVDPLALQIRHFCRVIQGEEEPLVSGREGIGTLKVMEAVKRAAATGELVRL